MISLNGVTLSNDLFWDNSFSEPLISQQHERVVLGVSLLTTMPVVGGRTIVLKAYRNGKNVQGFFTYTQIQAFRVLEQAGQAVQLIYESLTTNVVIKAGGVKVLPHLERPNPASTDEYSGTLTLIEV